MLQFPNFTYSHNAARGGFKRDFCNGKAKE
jgi:hypothetical protein